MIKKFLAVSCLTFTVATAAQAASFAGFSATYNGHVYSLLTSDTWTNSEAFAQANGGHLVAINDAAENSFVRATFGTNQSLWIGLERSSQDVTNSGFNTFVWSNGDALSYTNWAGGEPNNASDVPGLPEGYVHTYTDGTWNDVANISGYPGPKFGVMEVAAVPEPETYAMLLAGLGLMGAVARRRRTAN